MTRYCPRCDQRARASAAEARAHGQEPDRHDPMTEWASETGVGYACTICGLTLASALTAEEMRLTLDRDAALTRPPRRPVFV